MKDQSADSNQGSVEIEECFSCLREVDRWTPMPYRLFQNKWLCANVRKRLLRRLRKTGARARSNGAGRTKRSTREAVLWSVKSELLFCVT
jgi:hypothetical protein